MVLHQDSAVGDAVQEGLCPVPCGVEADSPPERAGAPEREGEDEGGEAGGEEAEGRLTGVGAVAEAEDEGEEGGGGPEAEGVAVGGLEREGVEPGEAAGEGEEQEAAKEVLLEEADGEEAERPFGSEAESGGRGEEFAIEDEQVCGAEEQDEEREKGEAEEEAGDQLPEGVRCATDAVGAEGAALDAGHGEGGDDENEKEDAVLDEGCGDWMLHLLMWCGGCRMSEQMTEEWDRGDDEDGGEEEEEEEAPACAQAVRAEEDRV